MSFSDSPKQIFQTNKIFANKIYLNKNNYRHDQHSTFILYRPSALRVATT